MPDPAPQQSPSQRAFWLLLVLSLVNAVFAVGLLRLITPLMKRRYDEYGLSLPALTKIVIQLQEYWWVIAIQFAGLLLAFCFWYQFSRHRRRVAVLWILLLLILPLAFNLAGVLALLLPEVKLQEGLRR